MPEPFKPIRFSGHAREQMAHRGTSEEEVREAVLEGKWGDADRGRRDSRKDFAFNAEWNGRRYATKQVRPVFVEETREIVVVTVYAYYF
ncbi:MAG: DUF4258 domain-containing protein [Pseudomonadota bacterium]